MTDRADAPGGRGATPGEREEGSGKDASAPTRDTGSPAAGEPSGFTCDLCGAEMLGVHCKLICPRCGYKRDCSDP